LPISTNSSDPFGEKITLSDHVILSVTDKQAKLFYFILKTAHTLWLVEDRIFEITVFVTLAAITYLLQEF
jgi:hypothetical protein